MSNDDPTPNLSDSNEDDKTTQPTITTVFRLLQDIDSRHSGRFEAIENRFEALENRFETLENRFEALENRLDQLETRLARNFASIDARFVELSNEMKTGFIELGDKVADRMDVMKLHHQTDYEELLRKLRRLESKQP